MSIAKRGVKAAEDAADLDLVEGVIGNPETDGEGDAPAGEPSPAIEGNTARYPMARLLLGWALGLAGILVIMGACATLPFSETDTDYSMLPDGYREATGLAERDADVKIGRQSDGSIAADDYPISPFPEAQTKDPVILEVDCPDGTVRISTGNGPADTVCVRGQLVDDVPVPAPGSTTDIIVVSPATGDTSTIAGTDVPSDLDCEEDEVIAFVGPDALACIHYEIVDAQ